MSTLLAFPGVSLAADNGERPKAKEINFKPKDETWKSLSLREKIGQTMIILANYEDQKKQFGSIDAMMKQYPVGGLFIPQWRFGNHQPKSDIVPNIRRAVAEYEQASRFPMIITEDFERGMGEAYDGFTSMPPEMAVGATNNAKLARRFGSTIANEARSIGVNWLLHPVADLNINPLNNLIVDRAISDDPRRAYPLLKSQIRGMADQNVVATVKHFPGDGATMKNQHLITSTNNMSMTQWNQTFGTLFQNLINDGAPSIMVGHIQFPAYQKETLKGVIPPATLSEELMVKLLKGEMKFNGVVMSDALNMGGIGGFYPTILDNAIATFKAGVDIVLWPGLEYMDEIEKRILSGEIPMARLDDAVERVWGVKERFGLLKAQDKLFAPLSPKQRLENQATAATIAQHAVTLLEDRHDELPLSPKKVESVGLISLSYNDIDKELQYTVEALKEKGFKVGSIVHNPNYYGWQHRIAQFDQYDKIVVMFGNRNSSPMGASMLKGDEAMGVWTANMLPFEKLIAVSYGNPYYPQYYLDFAPIKINAYGYDEHSQEAVVDALVGEIDFKGTSPVKLNQPSML